MSKKTLHVVTGLSLADPKKTVPSFEKEVRNIYRKDQNDPCVNFSHQAPPFTTADIVKKKKTDAVIFDSIPVNEIITIITAVKKRVPEENLPTFIHITGQPIVADTVAAINHEIARELVFN